jgi:hypothetical protein
MTGFFEPPPPRPAPADEWQEPVWLRAPRNMLGGVVPVEIVIGRSDRAAVCVLGVVAYPTGFSFTLALRRRRPDRFEPFVRAPFELPPEGIPEGSLPDDLLRFGFLFADGSKLTSIPVPIESDWDREPAEHRLLQGGGGGDHAAWHTEFWVWRLPPPGRVTIVCEWPAEGIEETRTTLAAGEIHAAAGRAQILWDDPGPAGVPTSGGTWRAYGGQASSPP